MKTAGKLLLAILLTIFLITLFVPFVKGSGVTIFTYTAGAEAEAGIQTLYPSNNASNGGLSITFTAANTGYVTSANFKIWVPYDMSNSVGIEAYLLDNYTGSITAQTALPAGSTVDTSDIVLESSLDHGTYAWATFVFSGTYQVTAGNNYTIIVLGVTGANWASAGPYGVLFQGYTGSTVSTNSQGARYHNAQWDYLNAGGLKFTFNAEIFGDTEPSGTPTPAPSTTATAAAYLDTSTYGSLAWYFVALFILLLPAGILGVMFHFGAWGFIIGLAIGAGLGYLLLPAIVPLWLVFTIIIGIVGMMMRGYISSSTGGGGSEE